MLSLQLSLLLACRPDDPPAPPPDDPGVGEGLFSEGCPSAGRALAREIGVDARLPGAVAVGGRGDLLLANSRAAFVITGPGEGATYYTYGGVVADAVAMDGCAPVSEDGLDEVGLVLGAFDLLDIESSILRGFEGTRAEVLADGSDGGEAIVRVTGTDAPYWLVEYELIRAKLADGGRPLSQPYGLELVVDYVLPPDDPVLRIEWTMRNPGAESLSLFEAALLSVAPTYDTTSAGTSILELGGLPLSAGIPWLSATDGRGALAYGVVDGNLAYTRVAGIDVALDLSQLANPIALPPGGEGGKTALLSVGGTDGPSATGPLLLADPGRLPDATATLAEIEGAVLSDGAPVPGARVDLLGDGGSGESLLDVAYAGEDGRYRLAVPRFDPEPWSFRAVARAPGRDDASPVAIPDSGILDLSLGPAGAVDLELTEGGEPVPAKVVLVRGDGRRLDLWSAGQDRHPVPPGDWAYTVTRGIEYEPVQGEIVVPEGGQATLPVALERAVDTDGWLSIDTHVHSAWSPDSRRLPADQALHAAAYGLDVVLHTEHELIVEQRDNPALAGVERFVASAVGQEVTAVVPEHMTLFPAVPDGSLRGGPVRWYGLDIAELWEEMHARSEGGINILNHPDYMDLIGWDVLTAAPTLSDPTLLGLSPGAALWSWDLDGIEVMNGLGSPFAQGNHRFELWQSLLNAGHPVTAVGASDDHGGNGIGFPRNYFPSDSSPETFDIWEAVDAIRAGTSFVSAGAFARVDVDGAGPGSTVAGGATVDLHVRIDAPRAIDVIYAVVFANCDRVALLPADAPRGVIKLDVTVPVALTGDTQLVVAAFGEEALPLGLPQFEADGVPRVLTNAIFVDTDGGGFDAPGGRICNYSL